ncbi:MAG: acyl-CoA dehydrogenase family protein [Acidimicrobiia bacterium]|nr:acyl-CoA dehydrogenase family protein [Acidimicrobiia bacterium]
MGTFELERIIIAAQSLGTARAALDEAITHAKERHQFGQPIGRFQAVAHMVADMATDLEACRAFIYSVADRHRRGEPCAKEAAMVKLFVTEKAKEICLQGMQILGGYGYMLEYPMQRHLRDSLLNPVGAGTSQIQRNIIAKQLGL